MEKTAIMEAIERIKNKIEPLKIAQQLQHSDFREDVISTYNKSIIILTSLLPKEREQIEQAYDEGSKDAFEDVEFTGENSTYFTVTYGETK